MLPLQWWSFFFIKLRGSEAEKRASAVTQTDGCRVGALTGKSDPICIASVRHAEFELKPFLDCDKV